MNYQIELLDPKAIRILEDLVKSNQIRIKQIPNPKNQFKKLLNTFRSKEAEPLDLDAIAKEVESVRAKRYKHEK